LAHRHRRAFPLAGLAARERLGFVLRAPEIDDRASVRLVVIIGVREFPRPRSAVTIGRLDRPRADAFVPSIKQLDSARDPDLVRLLADREDPKALKCD
jgi:hypothetical protein